MKWMAGALLTALRYKLGQFFIKIFFLVINLVQDCTLSVVCGPASVPSYTFNAEGDASGIDTETSIPSSLAATPSGIDNLLYVFSTLLQAM